MAERPDFTSNPFKEETSFGAVSAVITPVEEFREEVRKAMCLPDEGVVIEIHMREAVRGNGSKGNKHAGILGVIRESFDQLYATSIKLKCVHYCLFPNLSLRQG